MISYHLNMVIVVQRRDIWNWGGMDPERRIRFQSEVWKTPASESSWVLIKNWASFHTLQCLYRTLPWSKQLYHSPQGTTKDWELVWFLSAVHVRTTKGASKISFQLMGAQFGPIKSTFLELNLNSNFFNVHWWLEHSAEVEIHGDRSLL